MVNWSLSKERPEEKKNPALLLLETSVTSSKEGKRRNTKFCTPDFDKKIKARDSLFKTTLSTALKKKMWVELWNDDWNQPDWGACRVG